MFCIPVKSNRYWVLAVGLSVCSRKMTSPHELEYIVKRSWSPLWKTKPPFESSDLDWITEVLPMLWIEQREEVSPVFTTDSEASAPSHDKVTIALRGLPKTLKLL